MDNNNTTEMAKTIVLEKSSESDKWIKNKIEEVEESSYYDSEVVSSELEFDQKGVRKHAPVKMIYNEDL